MKKLVRLFLLCFWGLFSNNLKAQGCFTGASCGGAWGLLSNSLKGQDTIRKHGIRVGFNGLSDLTEAGGFRAYVGYYVPSKNKFYLRPFVNFGYEELNYINLHGVGHIMGEIGGCLAANGRYVSFKINSSLSTHYRKESFSKDFEGGFSLNYSIGTGSLLKRFEANICLGFETWQEMVVLGINLGYIL